MFFVNSAVGSASQSVRIDRFTKRKHTRSIATSFLFQLLQLCLENVEHIRLLLLCHSLNFGVGWVCLNDKVDQLEVGKTLNQWGFSLPVQPHAPVPWKTGLPRSSSSLGIPHVDKVPILCMNGGSAKMPFQQPHELTR